MSKRYLGGVITANPATPTDSFQDSAAPGMWTSAQQLQLKAAGLWPLFGNANPSQFIENLFSTYLYKGNNSTQTITNGIDLAGKGGLVWCKERNAGQHSVWDTARGVKNLLIPNQTAANLNIPVTYPAYPDYGLQSFNSNGFALGKNWEGENADGSNLVSWTFREQPKFFDVVTYTGTGVAGRTLTHNLGSVPGCVIIKRTNTTGNWTVWHRSLSGTYPSSRLYLQLNLTSEANGGSQTFTEAPTSTTLTFDDGSSGNGAGSTYVAYLFAHNAGGFGLSGTENVVSCGSYNGTGSSGNVINLGYEAQWVMIKRTNAVENWAMFDVMRGMSTISSALLKPNLADAESSANFVTASSTGFTINSSATFNISGGTYIYIAIRRGPMAVPTLGTTVYNAVARTGTGAIATVSGVGFPPDLYAAHARNVRKVDPFFDRLRGLPAFLSPSSTGAEVTNDPDVIKSFTMDGVILGDDVADNGTNFSGVTYINWFFKRAPSFFDEVCYTGTGGVQVIPHNLTVLPELIITKHRSATSVGSWYTSYGAFTKYMRLNATDAEVDVNGIFSTPTATNFTMGYNGGNETGATFVAYLFASAPGVSKVGSYTGTGTTQAIACGFTTGARFVLIKRTDATGDWYVWDSTRGIVAGNDPYVLMNDNAAEVTSTDYIDTSAAGFEISSTAPAAINASGGSYIFLAIS